MTQQEIQISSADLYDIAKSIKSFKNSIAYVFPLFILIGCYMAYRVSKDLDSNYIILLGAVFILPSFFALILPLNAIKKYNQLVIKLNITDTNLLIDHQSGHTQTNLMELKTSIGEFNFKGKDYPALILVDTKTGGQFVVLSKFYENYIDIHETLLQKSTGA